MSDAPSSFGSDPFGLGTLSGGQSAGITQPASTAGVSPQQASSDPSSPLGDLSDALSSLVSGLKQGNQIKSQGGDALSQFEQLIGVGPPPAAPTNNSDSILTVVAVVALLLLGAAVVWKLTHKGG